MSNNNDCISCREENCSIDCFNRHVGSRIALKKLVRNAEKKMGKKILLLDENGAEIE